MKKKVLFRGPLLSQSGYGTHARQIVQWLLSREKSNDLSVAFDVTPWGATSWYIHRDACEGLVGQIIDRATKSDVFRPDVSIQLQLPNEWDPTLARVNVGITAAVETDRCHPAWTQRCNDMSLVIVPSEFAGKSLGSVKNLKVVPEAYPRFSRSYNDIDSELDEMGAQELFLVFGQLTSGDPECDRKNTFNTLSWLHESLRGRPAKIILKTNYARNSKIDRRITLTAVQRVVSHEVLSSVMLLHGDLSDDEVYSLYTHKKMCALVNLSRGEGFCLPALEAASCGLPVIATDATGHTEFLRESLLPVGCKRVKIPNGRVDGNVFVQGASWYEPSHESFSSVMREFLADKTKFTSRAAKHANTIRREYSLDNVFKRYDEAVRDII